MMKNQTGKNQKCTNHKIGSKKKMRWCHMQHNVPDQTKMIKMKCRHKICPQCGRNIHMQCYNVWSLSQLPKYKCIRCQEGRDRLYSRQ